MKAITTRYIGVTERKPARILATDQDGNRATVPAIVDAEDDGNFPYDAGHRRAALALCAKMGWPGGSTLIGGSIKGGQVWVFAPEGKP